MKRLASAVVTPAGPNYHQRIATRGFQLSADEPVSAGGGNRGPTPYDEQWLKLIDIAARTPVSKTLLAGARITTRRAEAD